MKYFVVMHMGNSNESVTGTYFLTSRMFHADIIQKSSDALKHIREIKTCCSVSACQGLQRHRKLDRPTYTRRKPRLLGQHPFAINSCENTKALMGAKQNGEHSHCDWSAGLRRNRTKDRSPRVWDKTSSFSPTLEPSNRTKKDLARCLYWTELSSE